MVKFCCDSMMRACSLDCEIHDDAFECPDVFINYIQRFDEYGLIVHDGGSSVIAIHYCPFCGYKLPESKRGLWFEKLESMGFYDPANQDIPETYKTDSWFRQKS